MNGFNYLDRNGGTTPEKCADCGSTYIWRVPRRLLERFFAAKAFVCRNCGKRILEHRAKPQKAA